MKTAYKIILTALIIIFFSSPCPVYSSANRYGEALITTNSTSWDSNQIKMPSVIFDKSLYKMLYSGLGSNGRWQIGLAYSLDGINWIKYISPIKSRLNYDDRDVHDPTWLYNPTKNIYEMWYASSKGGGMTDFKIYYSTSINGIDWNNDNDILIHQPISSWETEMVSCPFVLLLNDKYYMWFSGRSANAWKIGLLTSSDGLIWTPEINNPVITQTYNLEFNQLISPEVYYDQLSTDRKFNIFYSTNNLGSASNILYAYSDDGITWSKPLSENPIIIKSSIDGSFDKNGVSESSIFKTSNSTFIWYGGHYLGSKGIGLAYLGSAPTPLPTPTGSLFPSITPTTEPTNTPTPEPTATPIPTPTPTPLMPIVVIPGLFSSWNKEEILENKQNTNSEWKLLNFVKEYDGLIETLKNLGYTKNQNLFIWPYDWRQSISSTTAKFNEFISSNVEQKNPNAKVSLVGHSLGGLIARTWTQANSDKVQHLITVGTPNQGVIQPYLAWEGGDASQGNSSLTFATQILLQLNKKRFQTNRETLQRMFPVLQDLLPTQPYLVRKSNNTEITKSQMHIWNTWQETINSTAPSIYPIFEAITGMNISTPNKYIVTQPNKIDSLLGNWEDGKPDSTQFESGDGTVTALRSVFSDDPSHTLDKNHGQLIASKEGIQQILNLLAIDYTENEILEGTTTTFAPGLLFLLQSPATILVTANGQEYHDQDGILYIPNASSESYTTKILGTGNGEYHLTIGQFGTNTTVWSSLTKEIKNNEEHSYTVSFQSKNPLPMPISSFSNMDILSQIDKNLQHLEQLTDKQHIKRLRIELAFMKRMLERKNYFVVKIQIETFLHSLAHIQYKNSAEAVQITFEIHDLLHHLYTTILQNKSTYFSDKLLKIEQTYLEKELTRLTKRIAKKNTYTIQDLLLIQHGQEVFDQGKLQLKNHESIEASFYFTLAHSLFVTH